MPIDRGKEDEKQQESGNTDLFTLNDYWVSGSTDRFADLTGSKKDTWITDANHPPPSLFPFLSPQGFIPFILGTVYATSWKVLQVLLILCHY